MTDKYDIFESILTAARLEGRERKRRVIVRQNNYAEARREYGKVPVHISVFLERARRNHATAVKRARLLHAVLPRGEAK